MHPPPMFPVINFIPCMKWGVYFMTSDLVSSNGHRYIIVAIDYFANWEEAMPTFTNDGETLTHFVFNRVISRFMVSREIFIDHGNHFLNRVMSELALKLGFRLEHSSLYYPQENGQVEADNKSLKTILKKTFTTTRSNWNLMLYPTLWTYQTSVKTTTSFSHFQHVHKVEAIFPIECEIPSLKIVVELFPDTTQLEECLIYLEHMDE